MALIPSGMGWSAEEEYMKQYAGIIAKLTGIQGAVSLPKSNTALSATGVELYSYTSGSNTNSRYLSAALNNTLPCAVFAVPSSTAGRYDYYAVAYGSGQVVHYATYINGSQVGTINNATLTSHSGSWYYYRIYDYGPVSPSSGIPVYSDLATGLATIEYLDTDVLKTSDGYCAVAWVKYKVSESATLSTPYLVSSNPAYTLFGPVENESYSVLFNGIRFYVSYTTEMNTNGFPAGILTLDYSGSNYPVMTPTWLFDYVAQSISLTIMDTIDPYGQFPHTGEDGGIPNPDIQDDDIGVDPLPTTSFSGAGFCRIYNPDLSDLQDLADYMWTDQNFLTTVINHLKQLIENPIDAVISLSLIPVVPDRESSKSAVKVMFINTGVSMRRVTNQFKSVDCGTVFVEEKYGSVLDYNPYTKVQLYLPFVGTVPLNTDEVMNKTLSVVYHVDVVTGVCCAEVSADSKLLYQFSGHCSVSQPLNSADFSSYLNAAMAAAKIAVGAATGGAGAAAAAGSALDQISPPSTTSPTSVSRDPLLPSGTSLVPAGYYGSGSGVRGPQPEKSNPSSGSESPNIWEILKHPGTINSAAAVLGGKLDVQHSGGFSGNSGFLAKRRPYLIINRPQLANPEQYGQFNGYPSMIYANLGTCTGYTQVQSVFLSGFDALPSELSEISSVLKAGVVF